MGRQREGDEGNAAASWWFRGAHMRLEADHKALHTNTGHLTGRPNTLVWRGGGMGWHAWQGDDEG